MFFLPRKRPSFGRDTNWDHGNHKEQVQKSGRSKGICLEKPAINARNKNSCLKLLIIFCHLGGRIIGKQSFACTPTHGTSVHILVHIFSTPEGKYTCREVLVYLFYWIISRFFCPTLGSPVYHKILQYVKMDSSPYVYACVCMCVNL